MLPQFLYARTSTQLNITCSLALLPKDGEALPPDQEVGPYKCAILHLYISVKHPFFNYNLGINKRTGEQD